MNAVHYTDPYLLNPQHKVTVNLIGLGGTGSQVLTCLARMNESLIGLGHAGIHVRGWDPDSVTMANIGRQLFSPSDVGVNKAIALLTRVNRFFGYDWEAYPEMFNEKRANIYVSCVDSAAARLELREIIRKSPVNGEPHYKSKYWLDIGNLQKTGQVVLGTAPGISIAQPKSDQSTTEKMPDVVKLFPQLRTIKEEEQGPSCSIAQSLNRQDLFINSTLAQFGVNLIWKLFREGMIKNHGCFVNLDSFIVNPIRIKGGKRCVDVNNKEPDANKAKMFDDDPDSFTGGFDYK